MKIRFKTLDLVLVFIATIICLIVLLKPNLVNSNINTILMILLILFLPGYSLVAVLYPKRNDLDIYERLGLSFGFPLIGLTIVIVLTNIISIKINLNIILVLVAILTLILIAIGFIRRKKVSDDKLRVYSKAKSVKGAVKPELYIETRKDDVLDQGVSIKDSVNKNIVKSKDTSKNIAKVDNSFPSFVSKDLLLIFLTTLLAIIFIITPKLNDTVIRTVLGLFLILFIPGYSLITALFPKKDDLDGIERAALSFGLSIAVTPLIGLALNYTPWGIRLTPILISLAGFTLIMLLIAFIRRRKAPEGEKFFVNFGGTASSIKNSFAGESRTSKVLSIILILTIILAIATTVYIIVKPKQGESFTEFYLLGPNGKASDYPTNLTVGQNGSVVIGVVNHEYQTVNYQLVVTSNGTVMSQQNITLTNGNQTQIPYSFTASSPGTKEIEFLLYKLPDTTNVYRSLHLFVNMN